VKDQPQNLECETPADSGTPAADLTNLAQGVESSGSNTAPVAAPATLGGELAQDPQMLADFLLEAGEHLANVETQLLALEQDPSNHDALHSAFRSFHTLKGLAGFLEYAVIQQVSHEVETVLDLARNDQLAVTRKVVDVVLASGDYLAGWLRYIQDFHKGAAAPKDPDELIRRVRQAARGEQAAAPPASVPTPAAPAPVVASAPAPTAPPKPEAPAKPETAAPSTASEASAVKVDTAKLEYLVEMVGELVIAQAMVRHAPELQATKTPRLNRNLAQLARVTNEVQKTAMAMRMVSIGILFRRMNRLVRDLAHKADKLAELETSGDEVELDRTIVEQLADPMIHMLRNSLDHGLEPPEEREAAGKPRCGKVTLKAWHQAGQIVIEIADDGRGLNRERILAKAVERGLLAKGETRPEPEIFNLIFEPGFSTAEKITDISGRGVGMDVVRKHLEKLRGRVDIESQPGQGTRFVMKLPLTLAIIDGLVVQVGTERYIVPLFAVREMFRPAADTLFTVEQKGEMALVRGRLLPVTRLYRRLGVTPRSENPCDGLLIVGEAEGRNYCLLVDELLGKQEVVIKSLGDLFQKVQGIAGGAILGDGRVGLILDLASLIRGHRNGARR
jgi:two-component system, chemotaxis family, sensor kinase CheA